MNPSDIQQIIDKYGRPVYEAALRQVQVHIVIRGVWIALLAIALGVLLNRIPWALRQYRAAKDSGGYDPEFGWTLGFVFGGLGTGILAFVLLMLIGDEVSDVLNPTWSAIGIILGAVGK